MENGTKELIKAFDECPTDLFRNIVEDMPGGFFIYRADGNEEILHVNKALLSIFGCDSREEFSKLTGDTFKGMVVPDDLDSVEKSIAHQVANNKNHLDYVEYRINHKDGAEHWVEDYGHFIRTDIGGIFYVFIADNTDRMRKRMSDLELINSELVRISARESQYRKAILYDALFFFEISLTEDKFITAVTQTYDGQMFDVFDSVNDSAETGFSDFINFSSKRINQNEPNEYKGFFDIKRLMSCYDNGELEQTYDSWAVDALGRKRLLHYVVLLGEGGDGRITALVMAKDITE